MLRKTALLACLLLCSCAAPPKAAPDLKGAAPVVTRSDTPVGTFPDRQWWKRYQDPVLDQLIELALQGSPSMATAAARAQFAESSVRSVAAQYGAKFAADAGIARQRLSKTQDIVPFTVGGDWYTLAGGALRLDVDFDWWGEQHAAIEAELDRSRAAHAEQVAAELTLSSAVATHYLAYQLERQRAQVSDVLVKDFERLRALQAQLVQQGVEAPDSLDRIDQDLADLQVMNVVLNGSWQLRQHTLAGFIGIPYSQLPPMPMRAVNAFAVSVPPSAGLDLIARRADVLASRWRVEAAIRDTDQARAGYYPNLKLSALIGQVTTDPAQLFDPASRIASFGAAVHLPIFDLRRLRATHQSRTDALNLAVAAYREAVNAAGQDVSLQATNQSGYTVARQRQIEREQAALRAYTSAQQRYARGLASMQELIEVNARYLRARDARLAADISLVTSQIALIKALGGGMDIPAPVKPQAKGESHE